MSTVANLRSKSRERVTERERDRERERERERQRERGGDQTGWIESTKTYFWQLTAILLMAKNRTKFLNYLVKDYIKKR